VSDDEALAALTDLRADFPDWRFSLQQGYRGDDWTAQRTDHDGVTTIVVRHEPDTLRAKLQELEKAGQER
jgi:alkanesulfonate monooxygenase SsuD/methylene tetrahydromethanopterin reductase-like flavin-dependent oxidoreductase (luciferase family)